MVNNIFANIQSGYKFAEDAHDADVARQRSDDAYNALRDQYGPTAGAPGAAGQLQNIAQDQQQFARTESSAIDESERALGIRTLGSFRAMRSSGIAPDQALSTLRTQFERDGGDMDDFDTYAEYLADNPENADHLIAYLENPNDALARVKVQQGADRIANQAKGLSLAAIRAKQGDKRLENQGTRLGQQDRLVAVAETNAATAAGRNDPTVMAPLVEATSRARAEGTAAGQAAASLPATIVTAQQAAAAIHRLETNPALATQFGLGTLSGWLSGSTPFANLPGSRGADVRAQMDQLIGKVFLEQFNQLRGGGAITEIEGQKATDAQLNLSRAQSPQQVREQLAILRGVLEEGIRVAQVRAAGRTQPAQRAPRGAASAPVATSDPSRRASSLEDRMSRY